MSMFDNIKDKAEDLVDSQGDKVGEGLEKAGEFADEKTGGKFGDQISQGVDFAQDKTGAGDTTQQGQQENQQ